MCQRQGHLLGGRETVFTVKNHAVAAIQHQHRGARALVFALMHVQVAILHVERHFGALAPDRRKQRLTDVQIERVAELILLRRSRRLDAGG